MGSFNAAGFPGEEQRRNASMSLSALSCFRRCWKRAAVQIKGLRHNSLMQPKWSPRISWGDLPRYVQVGVEQILGEPVVNATGQQGGFSPGTADRVTTVSGRKAFVKAVNTQLNSHSPGLHRKEAVITEALPTPMPTPSLIGVFDDGDWVGLVLSDVEGRHPYIPWQPKELSLVLDALHALSQTPIPPTLNHLAALEQELSDDFAGWKRIKSNAPENNDPWISENLDTLDRLAEAGLQRLSGDSLVHTDVRADNILITHEHSAVLVDWPWACIGTSWFDALTVLINVRVFDPDFDVDSVLESHPVFAAATDDSVDGVLSGLGSYFTDVARQPPPSGLPTVRSFQRQQGQAVIRWLRQRLSDSSDLRPA